MEFSARAASRFIGLLTIGLFLGAGWYGVWSIRPPAPVAESAAPAEFSSARAMRHLQVIASEPHPVGSVANARVRDYLVANLRQFDFDVDVQETSSRSRSSGIAPPIALVNIIARRAGIRPGRAVVLACHYDSAPLAPGAGDDGAAVAALLETARALKALKPLQNDLVILFTDGEEAGLLGAKEFVRDHPVAKEVGVIFNYDARGRGGPSILMETSPENGRLIREFARAAPYPLGASVANEVYQRLPNSTDMAVFIRQEFVGLNFCLDEGLAYYHQPTDSVQNVDERSVQQIGANALALARHFGDLELANLRDDDEIFFNPCGMLFVHYPVSWNRPLAAVVTVFAITCIVAAVNRRQMTVARLLGGVGAAIVTALTATGAVFAVSLGMLRLPHISDQLVNGDLPHGDAFLAAICALAIACGAACTALFRRQLSFVSLAGGGIIVWLVITPAACLFLPTTCYQCLWPVAWGCLGTVAALVDVEPSSGWCWKRVLAVSMTWASGGAIVVQIAPIIYLFGITAGSSRAWLTAIPTGLVGLLLVPGWELIGRWHRWLIPIVGGAIAMTLLLQTGTF